MRTSTFMFSLLVLTATACSGSIDFSIGGQSPGSAAEGIIEGEIADQADLGELTAECDNLADAEVGSTFDCIATTEDGRVIELTTVIDREDHIDVNTTNLLAASALPAFERAGTTTLGQQVGVDLPADTIDCGDETVVLSSDATFVCAFHDPRNTDVYDIAFEITDLDEGAFNIEVADNPRN